MFDNIKKACINFLMAIRIIKNPRYRIEISDKYEKEIVGFFKYKKDARKKANKLKEKYQTTTSKGSVEHEKSLKVVKKAKKLLKIAPKPIPKPVKTPILKKSSVSKIIFPTKWVTKRQGNRKVVLPKIVVPWNNEPLLDNDEFWKAIGSYLQSIDFSPTGWMTKYGWKKGNHPYLKGDIEKSGKSLNEIKAFVRKYKAKGLWISRGQICYVAKCHPERVKVTHIGENSEYWLSYEEAVKEVNRLKK